MRKPPKDTGQTWPSLPPLSPAVYAAQPFRLLPGVAEVARSFGIPFHLVYPEAPMTEQEWLTSNDPERMLSRLVNYPTGTPWPGRVSDRKLRLYCCACAHHIATKYGEHANVVSAWTRTESAQKWHTDIEAGADGSEMGYAVPSWTTVMNYHREYAAACGFLRDIFGNPFRPLPRVVWLDKCNMPGGDIPYCYHEYGASITFDGQAISPQTLTTPKGGWHTPTVRDLAAAIYTERRFADLPVLADALEDAGCLNEDILAHCRSKGPHVPGCWALDLLTGRE